MSKPKDSRTVSVSKTFFRGLVAAAALLPAGPARADVSRLQRVGVALGVMPADAKVKAERQAAEAAVEELVRRALATHPALATQRARLEGRAAALDAAYGGYHPKVAITGQAGRSTTTDLEAEGDVRSQSGSAALGLRQNLWRGGRDGLTVDLARADHLVAELERDRQALEIAFAVRQAAHQYNFAVLQHMLSQESAKDAAELLSLSGRKQAAGQVGKIDVHNASMREAEARARAAKAEVAEADALHALARAMGVEATAIEAVTAAAKPLTGVALPFAEAAPALAAPATEPLALRSAAAAKAKAESALALNRRARWSPELDFTASISRSTTQTETEAALLPGTAAGAPTADLETTDRRQQVALGLELTWPLWARPADHQIRVAAAEVRAAEAAAAAARQSVGLEAAGIQARIKALYATLPSQRQAWAEAGQLYSAQLRLYEAGAVDVFAVTDADTLRLSALSSWHAAIHDVRMAMLRWRALEAGLVPSSSGAN